MQSTSKYVSVSKNRDSIMLLGHIATDDEEPYQSSLLAGIENIFRSSLYLTEMSYKMHGYNIPLRYNVAVLQAGISPGETLIKSLTDADREGITVIYNYRSKATCKSELVAVHANACASILHYVAA